MLPLIQYRPSGPIALARETLADLLAQSGDDAAALSIEPALGGKYRLRAGKKVGLLRAAGLDLVIQPKIPTASVVWMLEYAYPSAGFGDLLPLLDEEPDVADAVAHLFCQRVAELVKRGLYREYIEREENLRYLRGRPLFLLNETINRGLRHQTYARHTELTADVWVNQILLLALTAVSQMGPASTATSALLRWDIAHFSEVALDYTAGSSARSLNRLNAHYGPTLVLAQFILRCVSFALKEGVSLAPRFLVDMNDLFQSYVEALIEREAWKIGLRRVTAAGLFLDQGRSESIRPDILLGSDKPGFAAVLDAKYKRESMREDLYQALAYTTVCRVQRITLVYPDDGDVQPAQHVINGAEPVELLIRTIPVARGVEESFDDLAKRAAEAARRLVVEATRREPLKALAA